MTDGAIAFALSVVAGGAWNLVNLWCLHRALRVWLGSPRATRRALWWFAVKFPGLYAVAVGLLLLPGLSIVGFGLGFTVVLISAICFGVIAAQRALPLTPSHGR